MASANQVQVALATWRESERRLWAAGPDERARRAQEVVQAREAYLRIIADHQLESVRDQIRVDEAFAAFTTPEDGPYSPDP